MNQSKEQFLNGLVKENPIFVLMLGMCPTLAVTTSAMNGLGMGLTTTAVLVLSNVIISMLRNIIPDKVRIPAFIVIIASFVTIVELLLEGFIPQLYTSLGIYIPLIVVNCIILGRAESFASKNGMLPSFFDGLGMGLGFSFALTCIGGVREILGAGEIFGYGIMPDSYVPISIFVLAPGAFFVLAVLTAIQNKIQIRAKKRGVKIEKLQSGCSSDCLSCGSGGCGGKFYDNKQTVPKVENLDKQDLEKKSPEKKSPEKKSPEKKTLEKKSPEKKALEKKSPEKKALEKKSPEKKALEKKSLEKKDLEKKVLEKKSLEKNDLEKKDLEKKDLEKKDLEMLDLEMIDLDIEE